MEKVKLPISNFHKNSLTPLDLVSSNAVKSGISWLDSSLIVGEKGKKSILGINPVAEISSDGHRISLIKFSEQYSIPSSNSIFNLIEYLIQKDNLTAIGYISYEATLPFLEINRLYPPSLPLIRFLIYDTVYTYDHEIEQFSENLDISNFIPPHDDSILWNKKIEHGEIHAQIQRNDYLKKINQIQAFIKEGDIYQANFTCRFDVESNIPPFEVYKRLRNLNPAPYSAFINFGDSHIMSSSPERMFTVQNQTIRSCPIKGTIALGETEEKKLENISTLIQSSKDKAELLMIVDLVRNDLGKIAQNGSVNVDSLYKTECYSSLIHLVSDISAKLKKDVTLGQIIKAILPGGSITGAPKKRAVEIINELEDTERSVYTGCIGYIDRENIDFNIAIRTMYHVNGRYYLHAGGGIVADSVPESEYDEMRLKAMNLFKSLGIQNV